MKRSEERLWQFWIDTGGTFTDCLAVDPSGMAHRVKVLSHSALRGTIKRILSSQKFHVEVKCFIPTGFIRGFQFFLLGHDHAQVHVKEYDANTSVIELNKPLEIEISSGLTFEIRSAEEAPILAARMVTQVRQGKDLPAMTMRLATTRGTNALLERHGASMVLFITRGFGDLLRIGTQQRPDLFALNIQRPEPLYAAVVEVWERIAADGKVIEPLRFVNLDATISRLVKSGIRVAAIALLHSYVNPCHEQMLAEYLLKKGFQHVSCSSELAPFIRILPRTETAVVNAYLAPVMEEYLRRVSASLDDDRLHVMTSAGGLMQSFSFHAKDSLLSGPAGGVVGAARAGRRSGFYKIISFDMGGTSTDVARFDGDFDYVFEYEVGDAHLIAPALAIGSVAAGGGSICSYEGRQLRVGPESAGAQPGPACYGAGGPLTLTDVNLLLGRLDSSHFEIPINKKSAITELNRLLHAIEVQTQEKIDREALLEGFLEIANERMADAIRKISIRKGYDPQEYSLVAFGGAGGQHACAVAGLLGIRTIIVPEDASLLSALGLRHAVVERFAERQVLQKLDSVRDRIPGFIKELEMRATRAVEKEGIPEHQIEIRRRIVNLRFSGQDSVLTIDFDGTIPLHKAFEEKYRTIFGHWPENRPVEVESLRVVASSRVAEDMIAEGQVSPFKVVAERQVGAYFSGQWQRVPVFERSRLSPGACIKGPALIFERHSATVVEEGWEVQMDTAQALILRRVAPQARKTERQHPEVVRLELFTNRFRAIAEEVGERLRRTAISTNIKERLDFSCALLDEKGELVVNAPHIPVHLGALGLCIRRLRKVLPMEQGDVVVTNHPAYGGSHLPDVTVVTPVYLKNGSLLGYVASRAHHAEIGGSRPGSMPPRATRLIEEGVIIPPMYLIKRGRSQWEEIRRLLNRAPFPSRSVAENMADLRAAVAANHRGAVALARLAEEYGNETIRHYMEALKRRAELKIREALLNIPDGSYQAVEELDDGSPLSVRIDISGDRAPIDFTGSAGVHPGNLNATPAIVCSVVIYVLRLLVNEPLPLNEGLMRAVTLHIPKGILDPPFPEDVTRSPAVVGGNVETSQRLVDTLLKALGLAAGSQGTMNNVLFGTEEYSYYETVCGGCGAGPDFDGASAVHSHMTNTRITDPEVLEYRYPVRVEKFALRSGSGGKGRHRGGDGVIREITFLEKMRLSVLGQHRREGPYGLQGGTPGQPGVQRVLRASGEIVWLAAIDGCDVNPGDRFVLETPGGGGYGRDQLNKESDEVKE